MLEYRKGGRRSSVAGLQSLGQMWRANPIGQLERRIEEWSGWEKTEKWEMVAKRIIYIVGFMCLVLLDHVMGSEVGAIQYGLKNYTGVVLGLVILTAYRLKDFLRIPYAVWTVVFLIGRAIIMSWASGEYGEHACMRMNTALWATGVYGLVVIRMLYLYIAERQKPKMNWPMFAVWLFMMVWMNVVDDVSWTRSILLFFAPFYLTNFREKDLNNLYTGLAEGIIIGFLIVQGWALMHRPYDFHPRYYGAYGNSNINALFYLVSYCAVLCKWYQMKLRRRRVLLRIPFILLAGAIVSLTAFTGGRAALATEIIITLFFLTFQALARKRRKILEFLLDGVILCVAILLCFEPTFKLVRYVPALVDDPVYIEGELKELKIQPGDSIDDEKYVEFEEMLENNFGRILWFLESEEEETEEVSKGDFNLLWLLGPALKVEASTWEEVYWYPEDTIYMAPGSDHRHPLLLPEEYEDPIKIRMAIWQYFFKELNLTGVHENTAEPWITWTYQAPHAHNFFLQMAYDFGWPVVILLIFLVIQLYNKAMFGVVERKSGAWYYRLFVTLCYTTVMVVFGMVEMCWMYGYLSFTMFFFVQYVLYHKSDVSKKQ